MTPHLTSTIENAAIPSRTHVRMNDPATANDTPPRAILDAPGMIDLVLRGQNHLSALLAEEHLLPSLVRKLLGLSVAGMLVHGVVVGAFAKLIGAGEAPPLVALTGGNPVLWMPAAFVLAFLGALCVCLPSFYFYTQLSGLDASFRLVTAQALRAQATTSVMLFGALPIYVAAALAAVLDFVIDPGAVMLIGLLLPFAVGLLGIRAVYHGFRDMIGSLPVTHARRGDFILRMVLCWGAVYTSVAPVALYRLAAWFSRVI